FLCCYFANIMCKNHSEIILHLDNETIKYYLFHNPTKHYSEMMNNGMDAKTNSKEKEKEVAYSTPYSRRRNWNRA
ncbi:MAG: hypothetical protein KKC75_02570, partial [Nanoarchaeota archaeon]|nr:hypothetical protein [Nanoarchaeota archaeon]